MKTSITQTKHTKKGFDLWVVRLEGERVPRARFKAMLLAAKKIGGWYSSYDKDGAIPGFQFKQQEAAAQFKRVLDGTPAVPPVSDEELLAVLQ